MNKTLVILKPCALKKKVCGEIIKTFEEKGLNIEYMNLKQIEKDTLKDMYSHLSSFSFFDEYTSYMSSAPVIVMVLSGINAINIVRKIIGSTNPLEAESGSIRGRFALTIGENIIHASDSEESFIKESSILL